jgi:hypothetical protein
MFMVGARVSPSDCEGDGSSPRERARIDEDGGEVTDREAEDEAPKGTVFALTAAEQRAACEGGHQRDGDAQSEAPERGTCTTMQCVDGRASE